jgi:DNA polymerase III alpha subunit
VNQTSENQTPPSPSPSGGDVADTDVVRKVFARDVKTGQTVNTVFRVGDKERHTAKSGKVFLSMTLFDRSGRLDGRIFDNVEAAEAAFANDDYLLVSGKVSLFHGKPQLIVERLEKLDPGPMDPNEFTPPALPAAHEKGDKPERAERPERPERMSKQTRQRLLNLLDDPAVSAGVEGLLKHLERYIDERVEQRLSGGGEQKAPRPPKPPREEREKEKKPAEPHKSGLPKDLAFKPFNALAPEPSGQNSPPTPTEG